VSAKSLDKNHQQNHHTKNIRHIAAKSIQPKLLATFSSFSPFCLYQVYMHLTKYISTQDIVLYCYSSLYVHPAQSGWALTNHLGMTACVSNSARHFFIALTAIGEGSEILTSRVQKKESPFAKWLE
jgi:hypothetical protein